MKTYLLIVFTLLITSITSAQKSETYFQVQYTHTLYDLTLGNNPWGIGIGAQHIVKPKNDLNFTLELRADAFLEDDKVARLYRDEAIIPRVGSIISLFGGIQYNFSEILHASFAAGPSLITEQLKFGVRPLIGFYFSPSKKWVAHLSYTSIFNRDNIMKADFGGLSVSVGRTL